MRSSLACLRVAHAPYQTLLQPQSESLLLSPRVSELCVTNLTLCLVLPQPHTVRYHWCESLHAKGFIPQHPPSQPPHHYNNNHQPLEPAPISPDSLLLHQTPWPMLLCRRRCPSGTTENPPSRHALSVLVRTARLPALSCATRSTRRCG
jgi:hypothetical protein